MYKGTYYEYYSLFQTVEQMSPAIAQALSHAMESPKKANSLPAAQPPATQTPEPQRPTTAQPGLVAQTPAAQPPVAQTPALQRPPTAQPPMAQVMTSY